MRSFVASLLKHRRLVWDFVRRDLRARYVGSSMGFFWSLIYPALNLAIYMFVFRLVLAIRFDDRATPGETALWMLCGIMVWSAFAETISRSTNCLVENQNLIQKVVFPSEVLPPFLGLSSLINMGIGLAVVVAGVVWLGYFPPGEDLAALQEILPEPPHRALALGLPLIALPLLALLQVLFAVGLGSLLATLNLFLRDTYHLVGVFVTVWMFATPIFYPSEMVLDRAGGRYAFLLDLNPMHWLIECYRSAILFAEWPDARLLARFALAAALAFAVGTTFFRAHKPRFPDLL